MAIAWIDDRWVKRCADDGTTPSAAQLRRLMSARTPEAAKIPSKFRKTMFGKCSRWQVMWRVTGVDGKPKLRSKAFTAKRDAEEFKAAIEDDIRRGRYRDPSAGKHSVDECARLWFASKVSIKDSTMSRYKRDYARYVEPQWASMPVSAVQPVTVQEWVAQLQAGTAPVAGSTLRVCLSPRSIRAIVRVVLGGIMGYAVAQHWVDVNPVHAVTLPRITTRDEDMVLLNVEDIERLADAAAHVGKRPDSRRWQNGALVRWQAYVGTRIGEALALRVGDIDFDRRRARVRATWSDGDGAPVLTVPKNGKQRTVAWPSLLEEELWRLCDGRDPDDFLFAAPRGGAWSVRNWRNRIWAPAMRAAGLADSGATIHSLRHTYASLAIKAGADVKTLQAQLGHASAMMTLDTYAALWPENLGTVADALDALVTG